ncbi:MAG: amino acid adenylation domain-containing protein, partial [bacterium]|nr:amino acid adenylation domain-containing protein [bacterium]
MIIKQFIQQVKRHPEKCAVKAADTAISYNELHQRTDYIAQLIWDSLHENKKEQPTALLFQHGIDMIAGVLATLKSGNIYVPFDPSYPEKRLAYMLADSRASLLVTNTANLPTAQRLAESTETPDKKIKILNIDSIDTSRPAPQIDESLYETDGIAYLLYTSGSTGKPKGVIQSHKNILHFIKCYSDNLEITDKDRLTLFSAFSHDAAVMDIYTALLKGATLYPLNIKEADITGIADWLKEEEITVWHSVPTIYRYFVNTLTAMEKFPHLRFLVMGGEAVLPEDVFRFKRLFPEAVFVNLYGQSESSYNSSQFITKDSPFEKVLLGDPIDEVTLLVVDEEGEEVAPFREGEIVVANNYAATGYWNDEEKTEQAFMEDEDMGRLYWTGDRGRLLLDDQIEFTGRVDFQIKIRGYRVELGEIETALLSHDSVEETVVVALDQADGQKMLCAYVVPAPGKKITIHELREFLAQEVMEHMIPSYFVQLEKLPVTPTGKIDRNALPEIEGRILTGAEYAAPTDKVEENLVAIWQEVLHQSKVGIDDHFFEIGGHSLRATVLAARVHKAMSIEFPLKEIFRTPTVRAMARYIRAAEEAAYSEIPRAKKRDFYPLSSAQKRMYLLSGIEGEGTGYNISKMVEIIGLPNKEKLENAFRQLVTRHDSLRTSFGMEAGQPVQVVHDGAPAPCDGGSFAIEWIEGDSASQNADTVALLREFVRPFDLGKAPLLRVRVTRLEARKHLLMMDMHHIIADGTSMGIIANDLAQLYAGESLPELRVQYKDFAAHQNGVFATGVIAKQQEYWKETFSDEIPLLDLPLDWVRPEVQSFQGGSLGFQLEPTSTKRLKEIASGCKTSLYMVLLALYNVLLSIYSRSEDVIVGTPTAGRTHPDLEGMVGMFVNTLAVRNYPRGEKTFLAFLEDVKKQVLDAFENQDYQFDALVDMLEIRRDLGRNPLFDTMFTLQNIEMPEIKANDLLFRQVDYEDNISKFDVTLTAYEMEEGLGMDLQYCSALFKRETVERMARHFLNIIRVVSADPLTLLESVDILSGEERRRILVDFNDTASDYPESKTIVTLLTEQAARTPGSVAVKGANLQGQMNTSLTYGDLLEQSYCLACTLAARGLGPGRTCAVVSGQTVEMIPAILGILRTGAAYVPIDPQYPAERIAYILEDSGVEILLTSVEVAKSITCKKEIFHLEWIKDLTETDTPLPPTTPSGAAYIIYTSGSTGKPKGVLTAHRALVNMCRWNKEYYQLQPTDRMSKYVGFGFDVSLWEIFPTLGVGACLCIVPDDIRLDVKKLNEFYEAEGVTISFLPPQIGEQFMAGVDNQSLRVLQVGGDKLRGYVLRNYRLVNNYGPTEYAVVTTSFPVTEAHQNIPIGKPIANTSLYVLGKNRQMQPVGAPGELYISGHGLALGYLNRPGLTADTFVPNPFEPGQRIYKTGDLVSWLPDGNMRFLGRLDSQVKIRGYRIELGEIENLLNRHEEIKNVTAIPRSTAAGEGDPYICAYVVPMNRAVDGPQLIQRLREYLAHSLPSYMVPAYFVIMEKIPLTANGKVNRKALPAPEVGTARIYKPPRNLLEERLVKSWSEVLAVDSAKIGIDDNFFEMGGHSLKAAALSGRVLKELNIPLPMREIFKSPTVSLMAAYLKERKEVAYKPVVPAAKRPYYPLTPAQKRLFILRRMESGGTAYNITTMVRVTGALDEAKIQQVFQQLVNRHKSLRTVFETVKGEAVARILPEAEIRLETYEAAAGRHEMAMRDFIRPFDMARAPLIRVGIIKPGTEDSTGQTSVATAMECRHDASGGPPRGVGFPAGSPKGGASLPGVAGPLEPLCSNLKPTFQGGQDTGGTQKKATDAEADGATCYLMMDMHHIISDGVSMGIITRELMDAYEGRDLPQLRLQYKDYALWLEDPAGSGVLEEQEKYWLDVFAGELPVPDIPTDFPRPALQHFEGRGIDFSINEQLTEGLKRIAADEGATLFMILLAVFNILLARYGRVEDIVVGTPTAGRRNADLETIVGMFVNTLPLRNRPGSLKPFSTNTGKEKSKPAFDGSPALRQVETAQAPHLVGTPPHVVGFVEELKERTLEAFDNQDYQFEDLIEKLDLRRDLSRSPLFDTMFTFQNIDIPFVEVEGLRFEHSDFENPIAKFDIILTGSESEGSLNFTFQYSTALFKDETMRRMAGHFENLVSAVVKNPSLAIGHLEMLSTEEKKQILLDFNDTASDYPEAKTIIEIFHQQVESTPENIAVKGADLHSGETSISYLDLHRQSSRLACTLAGKGLGPGKVGAVMSGQTVEMLPATLGILKTGAAYVPIAPHTPAQRIGYILQDSGADVFLTSKEDAEYITYEGEKFHLEALKDLEATDARLPVADPSAPAYIIYTSGSTGKPKGVITAHNALVNLCWWYRSYYQLQSSDRTTKYAGFGFDASLMEMFPIITVGGCLCIVPG